MRPLAVTCAIAAALVAVVAAEPRIRPIAGNAQSEEQRALTSTYSGAFGTGADLRTLLVHPEMVKGVLPFANYILSESTLPPRHRELLILRTAWNTRSDYLWAKHQGRATAAGLGAQELSAIAELTPPRWDDFERMLLRAADELHESSFVSNETWTTLAQRYSVHELMDAAFTVADMTMIAEVLNSARVDLEAGWKPFEKPELRRLRATAAARG